MSTKQNSELEDLAGVLAKWSDGYAVTVFLYGSRVRGDHREDSDVDIYISWRLCQEDSETNDKTVRWWTQENADDFASLKALLPGRLEILEPADKLGIEISVGKVVYTQGNVKCIWRRPK
jgi:predicted nucleotidyltransferase